MPVHSAGLLVYRSARAGYEVLLVHPGGPFFAHRDAGVWSIPKGEFDPEAEDPLATARREFAEETGHPAPGGDPVALGSVVQRRGKVVHAFAVAGDLDAGTITSNTFTLMWPPGSGRFAEFPEVDRAAWFAPAEARARIVPGQVPLLERLGEHLGVGW